MINMLKNLHNEESGQDLIEYALIGLIVALGAIAGMGLRPARSTPNSAKSATSSLKRRFACWKQAMQAGAGLPALPARKTVRNALGRACGYETIRQPRSLLPYS